MYAGTLARYQTPLDDSLDSWARAADTPPALDVRDTMQAFDGAPVQEGVAVSRAEETATHVAISASGSVDIDRPSEMRLVTSKWVAEPTDTGLVAAASTAATGGNGAPFPFDVLGAQGGVPLDELEIDIQGLQDAWSEDRHLADTWMTGASHSGTAMNYHSAASERDDADIGLGFEAAHGGTTLNGVVYASGYIALYDAATPSQFVSFVRDRVLDHCEAVVDEQDELTGGEA